VWEEGGSQRWEAKRESRGGHADPREKKGPGWGEGEGHGRDHWATAEGREMGKNMGRLVTVG